MRKPLAEVKCCLTIKQFSITVSVMTAVLSHNSEGAG